MESIREIAEFFIHIDHHLGEVINVLGPAAYLMLFAIIFAETGLVITPFLPGDSLLFMTGAIAALGSLNIFVLFALLGMAAIVGDSVNYAVGKYFGIKMFKKESRFLKKEYIERTHKFYEKYGAKTIVLARFVPIVRTFAPFVAGMGSMKYATFLTYNILGGVIWVGLFLFGGFWFGNIPIIKNNFAVVTLIIIFLSVLPMLIEFIKIRIKFRTIFQCLCIAAIFISICAATSYSEDMGSGNGYQIWIDSKVAPDADLKGKMYYISSAMQGGGDNDLRFQEFARYLENALLLSEKGYVRVGSSDEADIVIRIGYSVNKAQAVAGGSISWKSLIVGAYDLKDPDEPQLWRVDLYSKDGWVDEIHPGTDGLREMAPHMAIAAMPYFGVPSTLPAGTQFKDGKKFITIFLNDPRLKYIKNNSQAQGPAGSSALPASDLSGWPGIDVEIKNTNLFTAYHTIVSVVPGSPASRAGLMVGDHIFKIDDDDAMRMTEKKLMERMREAGSQMTLLIRKKGQAYNEAFPVLVTRASATSVKDQKTPIAAPTAPVNDPVPIVPNDPAPAVPSNSATDPSKGQSALSGMAVWGLVKAGDDPAGSVLLQVLPDGAMAKAGLAVGDIVVALDGLPVRNSDDLKEKYKATRPYTPVKLLILRSGQRLEKTFLPTGVLQLELKEVDRSFVIPAAPQTAVAKPSSALDALDNINVLKEAIIDPVTGQIALIGRYDPKYDTGPIPYLDLLKTALKYPEPEFSLLPEYERVQTVDKNDAKNVYNVNSVPLAILAMPTAEQERQLLIRQLAIVYGITPQEYVTLYNFAYLQTVQGLAPPEIGRIILKALRHAGRDQVAAAHEKLSGKTADSYAQALKILGWEAEAAKVLADTTKDTRQKEDKLLALNAAAIMDKAGIGAERAGPLKTWAESGEMAAQHALDTMYKFIPIYMEDKDGRVLALEALARIPIGDAPTRILCGIDNSPIYVRIKTDNLSLNTNLTRILYEADYAGKTFLLQPELFDKVPGQITYSKYLTQKFKGEKLTDSLTIDASFWFEPKRVEMRVSPDKKVVQFGASEIRFTTRMDGMKGSSKEELERLVTLYKDWCAQYTDKYEQYAQIMPAFHRLRESAKVVALAKWLNSEKIHINLDGVAQEWWEPPAKIIGSWRYGAFSSEEAPGKFTYPKFSGITGGVTFKPKKSWTVVESAPQGETGLSDQLKLSSQLGERAVDAAKSGSIENARYLSDLSAQALTGEISRADLIKLNVPLADPVELPASPGAVLLQKEMIRQTHDQIISMEKDPASRASATATLSQIKNLYGQVRQDPANASDYLKKMQTGQLSVPPAPVAEPAAPTVQAPAVGADELELRRELLGNLADTIRKRTSGTNPAAQEIIRSLKAKKPPELESQTKNIDNLVPGDVILVAPVLVKDWEKAGAGDVLISNAVNLLDKWGSNCWSSPASHAAVFLGERNGKRWYMDNTSEHGPVIREEQAFLKEYGQRTMDVATLVGEPISPAEGEAIFKAAHELRDAGIRYGVGSDKRMVCSDAARWLLLQAGRDIPATESGPGYPNLITAFVQKKDVVNYSPADYYDNRQYFVIRPLNTQRK